MVYENTPFRDWYSTFPINWLERCRNTRVDCDFRWFRGRMFSLSLFYERVGKWSQQHDKTPARRARHKNGSVHYQQYNNRSSSSSKSAKFPLFFPPTSSVSHFERWDCFARYCTGSSASHITSSLAIIIAISNKYYLLLLLFSSLFPHSHPLLFHHHRSTVSNSSSSSSPFLFAPFSCFGCRWSGRELMMRAHRLASNPLPLLLALALAHALSHTDKHGKS